MSKDWNMPRRSDQCAACAKTFDPGQPLTAYLFETDAGYLRQDYCQTCHPPAEPQPLGSWQTRRPEPATRRAISFDTASIYAFFQQLEDADTTRAEQLRFLLALLLWRKKALSLERTASTADAEVWEFAAPKSDIVHRVRRPVLSEDELEQLSGQIEQLMSGEMPTDETVSAESSAEQQHD